jgi:tetratricopeptide (TPR) repeat protein/uncharacterized caspase-like protein
MKSKLRQFNFAFLLVIQMAFYFHASAQRTAPQRPNTQTQGRAQGREVLVKEMSGAPLDGRGKLWAVVIGVSKYKNLAPNSQLQYAHRDAEDFAAFLRSPNGGGFPSSQLTLLTNQSATLSAIRSSLGTILPRSVEPDDMVVIFFAGHGVVEGESDGYLLAYDSDPQNLYATALQVSELNRIISERLKARNVILIADACHSGRLGFTSRSVGERAVLVNRFLDEVGKSGKGVFRLLGSRQDQLSYEGANWGGGHGAFTWFLLEGLRGKADRDRDGYVRVGELLDFLSESVPKATQSLQHPRAAGDIDTQLPMAVVAAAPKVSVNVAAAPKVSVNVAAAPQLFSLELHGAPGLEVYLDNSFRGRVLPNGVLIIGQLNPGEHDLSILSPGAQPFSKKVSLIKTNTILRVNSGGSVGRGSVGRGSVGRGSVGSGSVGSGSVSSPLVAQIKQSLNNRDLSGAFNLYQQLVSQAPGDPQRASIEATLSSILEPIGQNAINFYVQSSGRGERPGVFKEAAEAFRLLKIVTPNADQSIEAKLKFCEGKAMFDNKQFADAAERFKSAVLLDPRAAYAYSALGMAYRNIRKDDQALASFKRAVELAPSWALPYLQMGVLYRDNGDLDKAREAFQNASRFDPGNPRIQEQLIPIYMLKGDLNEAERLGNEIVSKYPDSGLAYLWLGQIYEQTGHRSKAAKAYERGLALPTDISPEQRDDFINRLKKCRKKGKK